MVGVRPKKLIDRLPPHPAGDDVMAYIARLREGPCAITLDASLVEAITPSALEGLLVIAQEQRARGNEFALANESDAFLAELALFGIEGEQLKGPGS